MPASEVTADGRVIAPLNIKNPAPLLDVRGFQFAAAAAVGLSPGPSGPPSGPKPAQEQSSVKQVREQLHEPGGPGTNPRDPLPFPLSHFKGAYAGNGFNLIWRPKTFPGTTVPRTPDSGPADHILELNLTTEQMTFGSTLGSIPNRGFNDQPDIFLGGMPYFQTVQKVEDESTGLGNKPRTTAGSGIHFETGVWLSVPAATFQGGRASVVRMASIPHGTTINAQGFIPLKDSVSVTGGAPGGPNIHDVDTTPFRIDNPQSKIPFPAMFATPGKTNILRLPQNLDKFIEKGTITSDIIKNPNLVLKRALKGAKVLETTTFEVSTGPPKSELSGGGTANIAFLGGRPQPAKPGVAPTFGTTVAPGRQPGDNPNAHADFVTARFWIEHVEYTVRVPELPPNATVELLPDIASDSTAPTPQFAITAPDTGVPASGKVIKVPGIQIQYSQVVNLNFGPGGNMLTWPHVSVATLVPVDPQPYKMTAKDLK